MKAQFARAAASYDAAAVLARETGKRLGERLSYTRVNPARFADIGCATGDGVRELQQRFPKAQALAIDFALPMLQAVRKRVPLLSRLTRKTPHLLQADVARLPLADASLDLAWSNLMFHWLDDPLPAFKELHRVTATGGLVTFALLGPDTFKEWRQALKVSRGGTASQLDEVAPEEKNLRHFPDMHDIGDMLVAAGFGDPVMDREDITLTYTSARALIADQRHLGVRNAIFGHPGWRQARRAFAAWERQADGRLPVTFEIVYGQAWKPAPRPPRQTAEGHAIIQFQSRPQYLD
jgi:malonyl-CoA O-methyltransferase